MDFLSIGKFFQNSTIGLLTDAHKVNFEKVVRQVTNKFPFGLKTLLLISCLVLFPAGQIFEISYCQIKNYLILTIPRSKVAHLFKNFTRFSGFQRKMTGINGLINRLLIQNMKNGQYGDRTRDIRVISTTL